MCSSSGKNNDEQLRQEAQGPTGRADTHTRAVTETVGNGHKDSPEAVGEPRPHWGSWVVGIGRKAFEQAAPAGRPREVERGTGGGQQPGALALQGGALGLKPKPSGSLVYSRRTYKRRAKTSTGRNQRVNWMEPGAKAAGQGPVREGLVPEDKPEAVPQRGGSNFCGFFFTSLSGM